MALAKVQEVNRHGFQALLTATSGTLGATPTSGNLLIGVLWTADNAASRVVTPPSGWSMQKEWLVTYGIGVYYKVATGSESTTYTWTWTVNSASQSIYLSEWSGADTSTPIDIGDTVWTDFGVVAGPITVPAITTVTANALHLILANCQDQGPGYSCAAYTEELDVQTYALYSKVITSPGSTGTQSVTLPTTQRTTSYSFALRPSSGSLTLAVLVGERLTGSSPLV